MGADRNTWLGNTTPAPLKTPSVSMVTHSCGTCLWRSTEASFTCSASCGCESGCRPFPEWCVFVCVHDIERQQQFKCWSMQKKIELQDISMDLVSWPCYIIFSLCMLCMRACVCGRGVWVVSSWPDVYEVNLSDVFFCSYLKLLDISYDKY